MKRSKISMGRATAFSLLLIAPLFFALAGCGGGGGGGGGADTGQTVATGEVSLVSITFPEYTDLSGGSTIPPVSAPLSQQIVLTFSGSVQGTVTDGAVEITASPGKNYSGPEVALDNTKNLIVARGGLEVMNNIVIFTPYIPTTEIDLSPNAPLETVPGLLPGYAYTVFVPVQTEGAVTNLVSIDSSVKNPINFTTVVSESLYFNYRNQPALPPEIVSTNPPDGAQNFNFFPLKNRYETIPEEDEIFLQFDQPLDFRYDNLEGVDLDGDGIREQNLFLKYTGSSAYLAVDKYAVQFGFLARLETGANSLEFIGYTNDTSLPPVEQNIGLKSVFFVNPLRMVGCTGDALYDVDFMNTSGTPLVCELTNRRELKGDVKSETLTTAYDNKLYGIDAESSALIEVNYETGGVKTLGPITSNYGTFVDLAMGFDGELYALQVIEPGTSSAMASIERIDMSTLVTQSVASALPGDFVGMVFTRSNTVTLFEYQTGRAASLDLANPNELVFGDPVDSPLLSPGKRLNFDFQKYELGVDVILVDNDYKGAKVKIRPSGILPTDSWIDIMIRSDLTNLSGGSLNNNESVNPWLAVSAATFKTKDPGSKPFADFFEEQFLDNTMEEINHELSNAAALWNVQDVDSTPPNYQALLASLGLTGAGELGDFVPIGISPTVFLDTNYQPLPLFDGSTPGVSEPVIVTDGQFHFHNITIPFNVTIQAQGTNPLVFTATGEVEIAGTIDVSGIDGATDVTFNSAYIPTPGGKGGPGGGRGGMGQPPIPENFSSLTQLQSPAAGERGWGPGDVKQVGGWGGESGSKGTDVAWKGSAKDVDSRGAGGGGGTYFGLGKNGYPGMGQYSVDENGQFFIRDAWEYWDGTYKYNSSWDPIEDPLEEIENDPSWHNNHWYADDPNPNIARAPHEGKPGDSVFKDLDVGGNPNTANDFIGRNGELKDIQGGQGGGGAGSRMDSQNPQAAVQAAGWTPPLPPSAYDSKGGGGGGGGGAIAIHSLGEIVVLESGRILARGGHGGGGEVIGHSNFGGGGGAGSGGAIILNSATGITIMSQGIGEHTVFGHLDVSGGRGADARANVQVTWQEIPDPCKLDNKGFPTYLTNDKAFCHWSRCDGGAGGHGIIQLMVPDPLNDLKMRGYPDPGGDTLQYLSILADRSEIGFRPDEVKYNPPKSDYFWARYNFTSVQDGLSWYKIWPKTSGCLVDPEKTISTINAQTFAVTKWVDLGRVSDRPPINGKTAPVFYSNGFHGFRGITTGLLQVDNTDVWGLVETINGFVVTDPSGENDIDVSSPDLYQANFVDETNRVGIMFQGTDAVIPGSKVPDENAVTQWTTKLSELHGKQFVRYKIGFNAAYDSEIKATNIKPQVDRVRLRFKY